VILVAQQKIQFLADLKFNISSGQSELLQMQKTLEGINTSMAGVGDKRAAEAQKLATQMSTLATKDTSQMTRAELIQHQKEMNDLKARFFKITNEVVGSQVSQLAKTQEEKDALIEINKQYDNKTKAVNKQLELLDELAKKTKEFRDSAEATAPVAGMSVDDLADPTKVQKALEGTMEKDGTVTKGQEAKHAALQKHLEVVNRLKMTGAETLVK
jgi:hypothetical protein